MIADGSAQILQAMLAATATSPDADTISRQFLGALYGADTLVGSADVPEQLVIDLERVDRFTYADYVEALKRADTADELTDNLVDVHHRDGIVGFATRKHFFTDWSATTPALATDITAGLSDATVEVPKNLNQKDSGGVYLPSLPVVPRTLSYVPSDAVDTGRHRRAAHR
ncbi:hypothetical protein MMUR_28920 [Mycolicibacterium murale]|uniref:Uncharacterized protein n=1 Tax=Mycolicibacterium murale TaxID=182220 RepID=A0A7I9WNC1_9MYCO|nr:N-acetylmuramoyl-L-alanine amidase-like domain-containing protein [Mycolicibacterium murale]GFG58756.1 hypothetical protein MMUR_28920 [Mycolicibacterium murale]